MGFGDFRRPGAEWKCAEGISQDNAPRTTLGSRGLVRVDWAASIHGPEQRQWESLGWCAVVRLLRPPSSRVMFDMLQVLDHVGGHSLPVPHTWLTCRIRHRTAVAGLSSWFGIGVTYIRFYRGLKAQGIDRMTLPYRAPLQPFAAWYATIGCFIVVLVKVNPSPRRRRCSRPLVPGWRQFSGWFVFLKGRWATDTFVTNYLPMVMFPVLYVGAKWYKHATLVPYAEMDFKSGLQEVLDASYVILRRPAGAALPDASGILSFDEPPVSGNWAKRAWNWLVRRQYYYASNEKY